MLTIRSGLIFLSLGILLGVGAAAPAVGAPPMPPQDAPPMAQPLPPLPGVVDPATAAARPPVPGGPAESAPQSKDQAQAQPAPTKNQQPEVKDTLTLEDLRGKMMVTRDETWELRDRLYSMDLTKEFRQQLDESGAAQ